MHWPPPNPAPLLSKHHFQLLGLRQHAAHPPKHFPCRKAKESVLKVEAHPAALTRDAGSVIEQHCWTASKECREIISRFFTLTGFSDSPKLSWWDFSNTWEVYQALKKREVTTNISSLCARCSGICVHTFPPTPRDLLWPMLLVNTSKRIEQSDWNLTNCFAFSSNLSRSGIFHEKSQHVHCSRTSVKQPWSCCFNANMMYW